MSLNAIFLSPLISPTQRVVFSTNIYFTNMHWSSGRTKTFHEILMVSYHITQIDI